MSRTRKTLVNITGTILLLIVLFFIVLATFDWNRLKPTINQKVSAELNRPFAIRGDLGVVWERQPDERGWRSWIPWPHVHAEDIVLGNPPAIPQVTMPSAFENIRIMIAPLHGRAPIARITPRRVFQSPCVRFAPTPWWLQPQCSSC